MAAENFDPWYARADVYEKGKDDDKRDPGGRTGDGVTQREYDVFRARKGRPRRDVWYLNDGRRAGDAEAITEHREIFRGYWDRVKGDQLPAGLDFIVADGSLNSGPAQSAKWLQRAIGVSADGEIGPATLKAANDNPDHDLVVVDICRRRLAFMQSLSTWGHFGRGWSARVANCQKIGTAWATGSIGPDPVNVQPLGGSRKANPADVKQPIISVSSAQIATGAGFVSATATQAAQQMQAFSDTADWIKYGLAGITFIGVVAGIVAQAAASRAAAAHSGEASVDVDTDADQIAIPIPVTA